MHVFPAGSFIGEKQLVWSPTSSLPLLAAEPSEAEKPKAVFEALKATLPPTEKKVGVDLPAISGRQWNAAAGLTLAIALSSPCLASVEDIFCWTPKQ